MFRIKPNRQPVRMVIGAVLAAGALVTVGARPAAAAVKPVLGSAYGYKATVSFFGGVPMVQKPTPTVKLPTGGSAAPITKSVASGSVVFGPATLFTSGPITVSTMGQSGNAGATTSLQTVNASSFTADAISSTCTASNGGAASGSVSVTNGVVVTSTDANGNPLTTMPVPSNPGANLDIPGSMTLSPSDTETFDWIFNEQTLNTNGSLTVNAAHEILHGPTAVGNLYMGNSHCRS